MQELQQRTGGSGPRCPPPMIGACRRTLLMRGKVALVALKTFLPRNYDCFTHRSLFM
jgi:hypothetical protein